LCFHVLQNIKQTREFIKTETVPEIKYGKLQKAPLYIGVNPDGAGGRDPQILGWEVMGSQ